MVAAGHLASELRHDNRVRVKRERAVPVGADLLMLSRGVPVVPCWSCSFGTAFACDTRSHRSSGQLGLNCVVPDQCSKVWPHAHMRRWQRRGVKLSAQGSRVSRHLASQAEGQSGRANESEPLSKPRHCNPPDAEQKWRPWPGRCKASSGAEGLDPRLMNTAGHGAIGGALPGRILTVWNVETRLRSREIR